MNHWKEIWRAYHSGATRTKIFLDIIRHASTYDLIIIVLLTLIFFISAYYQIDQQGWWLALLFSSEFGLFYYLYTLKNKVVLNEYGGEDDTQAPPSNENHQSTRYLIFKNRLMANKVTEIHTRGCFELVEAQIDIVSTNAVGLKNFSTFILGILAGILATLWKQLDNTSLMLLAFSVVLIGGIIYIFANVLPSKLEKLKELKYFMLLYCREVKKT